MGKAGGGVARDAVDAAFVTDGKQFAIVGLPKADDLHAGAGNLNRLGTVLLRVQAPHFAGDPVRVDVLAMQFGQL